MAGKKEYQRTEKQSHDRKFKTDFKAQKRFLSYVFINNNN